MARTITSKWAARHSCFVAALLILVLSGCGNPPARAKGPVQVVATIAPLADWTRVIGGGRVRVTQLVPAGRDPRSYSLTAADRAAIARADILLLNGQRLEPWLDALLARRAARPAVILDISEWVNLPEPPVTVRRGLPPLNPDPANDQQPDIQDTLQGQTTVTASPYQWLDPSIARQSVTIIAQNLARVDPAGLTLFHQNAAAYTAELENLDNWIQRTLDAQPLPPFEDVQNFMQPFRLHFKWPKATTTVTLRTPPDPPVLIDALTPGTLGQYTLQQQHGRGRVDPLNNDSYLLLMRAVTQQVIQGLRL